MEKNKLMLHCSAITHIEVVCPAFTHKLFCYMLLISVPAGIMQGKIYSEATPFVFILIYIAGRKEMLRFMQPTQKKILGQALFF